MDALKLLMDSAGNKPDGLALQILIALVAVMILGGAAGFRWYMQNQKETREYNDRKAKEEREYQDRKEAEHREYQDRKDRENREREQQINDEKRRAFEKLDDRFAAIEAVMDKTMARFEAGIERLVNDYNDLNTRVTVLERSRRTDDRHNIDPPTAK